MKTTVAFVCLLALTVAAGCSSIRTLDQDEIPSYTLNEIRSQPKNLTNALLGADGQQGGGTGVIVSVPKGDRLPFDISARLPFASLVTGGNWLQFEQDVWFYFADNDFLISPDGERFGPIYDMRALKELFNFEAGNLSLGFGVTSRGGARAALTMESKSK